MIALAAAAAAAAASTTTEAARSHAPVAPTVAAPRPEPQASPVGRFTLANGLKVVVQPDARVPIVTVAVVYNVGSKDETPGQFGYAHLFEHLMIQGSLHWNQNASRSFRDLGAPASNATTTEDRTIFYETLPRAGLERTLFLEADRMGYLAEALTPERVAREVEVVLNEKRQRGGAPYGEDWATIFADLYPTDHPYHHSVIGTETDLRAVTVEQARRWFRDFYGPANATLILTGDVSAAEARVLAAKYFGALAPRPPVSRLLVDQAPLPGPIRRQTFYAVPAARVYATYRAPSAGSAAIADLDLIAQIMGNGTGSRLSRRLVTDLGLARAAMVTFNEKLLSSEMGFVVDGVPPDKVARVETEVDAALARLAAEGPTAEELGRARAARVRYLRQSQESTFGKAFVLMRGATLTDDPDYAATYLRQLEAATPERVRRTAAAVYGAPGHHLIASPLPALKAAAGGYDMAKGPPPMGVVAPIVFPAIEQGSLSNGLDVVLVRRPGTMSANLLLRFDAGSASATAPVPAIAAAMLAGVSGTPEGDALAARLQAIGARLQADATPDHTDLAMSVDAERLDQGARLLGELLTRPQASAQGLSVLRRRRVAALRGEATQAGTLAQRLVRNSVYGDAHPYGRRRLPAADMPAVEAIDPAAVAAWERGHVRPDRATLYVAADTDLASLRPRLEAALREWKGEGPAATPPVLPAAAPTPAPGTGKPSLTVVDMPGATQTLIVAGRALPPSTPGGDLAMAAANEVFGGNNTSRIGTNLRQQKGWTYGIGSGAQDARGPRLWQIAGSVTPDHSGDAIAELIAELRALGGSRPPEQAELDRIVAADVNQAASRLENGGDLLKAMADAHSLDRPFDAIARDPLRTRALTLAEVRDAARTLGDPSALRWVVVGDWQRIRGQFAMLDLGIPVVIAAGG